MLFYTQGGKAKVLVSDEKSHIDILKEKAILYHNQDDLENILSNFHPDNNTDWDCYSKDFNPTSVMKKFEQVFINS